MKLVISDQQEPFSHDDFFDFVSHVKKTFLKKDDKLTVINVGDEVDQHTLSKYSANPNGKSAGDELNEAIRRLQRWYKEFPKVYVCKSNHTWRAYKKAREAGIPSQFLRYIGEVLEAPSTWIWADRWVIDNIVFEHGENVSGPLAALNAAQQNRMSTVIGHQHTHAGVIFSDTFHNQIWGMNVGCGIDVDQYAFEYGQTYRKKPTLGCGIIIDETPLFIPMILTKGKRWTRRIP